ncbi:recombinase family protein, partial [Mycobacterium sp.]|uniref:recombinase family protein n=1 Tax=Mycobacterium sp. TaxID=1785 RepID=UPI002BA47656
MLKALVGARVSSMQGDGKTSHITQRSKGTAYAESQGWEVVGAFEDLDVSAIKLSPFERPDLRVWLEDRAEDWDALIFAKTDRVFRSAADCVRLAEWCKENRKILVLVDDGIKLDYYNPEESKDAFAGAMSKVFLILASVFAEIEGQRFVQRARDRVAYLRHTDRWGYGVAPFGYQVVDHPSGKGKALDHDLEAQAVLSSMVTRFLAGDSLTNITASLLEAGTPCPRDWARIRAGDPPRGERWTTTTVRKILLSPSTQGIKMAGGKAVLGPDGEPIQVGPASFDQETWGRLQRAMSQRAGNPRERRHSTNPLLGVAKCGVCGKNMRQHGQNTKAGVYHRYYLCNATPRACRGVSIVADVAEELVAKEFLSSHADRKVKKAEWQMGSDYSAELEQTTQTIEALREDRALGLFTTPEDQEMYRQQMAALVAKRDALAELPFQKAGWVEVETDQTYGEVWPDASVEERRKMLTDAGVVLRVIRPNHVELYTDFARLLGGGPSGLEVLEAEERRASAERKRWGIPEDEEPRPRGNEATREAITRRERDGVPTTT